MPAGTKNDNELQELTEATPLIIHTEEKEKLMMNMPQVPDIVVTSCVSGTLMFSLRTGSFLYAYVTSIRHCWLFLRDGESFVFFLAR